MLRHFVNDRKSFTFQAILGKRFGSNENWLFPRNLRGRLHSKIYVNMSYPRLEFDQKLLPALFRIGKREFDDISLVISFDVKNETSLTEGYAEYFFCVLMAPTKFSAGTSLTCYIIRSDVVTTLIPQGMEWNLRDTDGLIEAYKPPQKRDGLVFTLAKVYITQNRWDLFLLSAEEKLEALKRLEAVKTFAESFFDAPPLEEVHFNESHSLFQRSLPRIHPLEKTVGLCTMCKRETEGQRKNMCRECMSRFMF